MARADLIVNLVRAGVEGDQGQISKTVEAIAAEARAKRQHILADRLVDQLKPNSRQRTLMPAPPPRPTASNVVVEREPRRTLDDLVLPEKIHKAVSELIEEQARADLLRAYNLEPRHRLLLVGPPGNGKTSLAEAIASALAVPMIVVRYESVIGSFLGETAQRLSHVFELVRSRNCVLFFDEFDAIGKERGDVHETGEIKRVVSSLLLQVDALPSYVVIVVASNHPELLDRAVWRRFQVRLELPKPDPRQIEELLRRFERRYGHSLGLANSTVAKRLAGANFSEVEDFGLDVLRRIALSEPEGDTKAVVAERLKRWDERYGGSEKRK